MRAAALCACLLLSGSAHAETSLDDVLRLVQERDVRSVEQLLPLLPEPVRSHAVFVFQSRSIQGATPDHPRTILYSEHADLVLAFSTVPQLPGYDAVEALTFDPEAARFELREIRFPGDRGPATFSEANPARCLRCHGEAARPIWDAAPTWPGVYGQRYRGELSSSEREGLQSFLSTRPMDPRLRSLSGESPGLVSRAAAGSSYIAIGLAPSAELSTLLSRNNFRTIVRELEGAAGFATWGAALLASLDPRCGSTGERLEGAQAALEGFAARTEQADEAEARLKSLRMVPPGLGPSASEEPEELIPFRFLAERALGVSTRAWTLALEKGTYDFQTPGGTAASMLVAELSASLVRLDAGWRATLRVREEPEQYCRLLRARTPARLVPERALAQAVSTSPDEMLRARCLACHDGKVGPAIPFGDPRALSSSLGNPGYPHGTLREEILFRLGEGAGAQRMPVDEILSTAERASLDTYLAELTSAP
jgi:mono/diheme cytochrome c family protein